MSEKDYWLGFSVFSTSPFLFQQLLKTFGSAQAAWEGSENALSVVLQGKKTKEFLSFKERFDFEGYNNRLQEAGVFITTLIDSSYPKRLKNSNNPPFVLYVKTKNKTISQLFEKKTIAIVGTRKVSSSGREVTKQFIKELVASGYIVVSGMALGVDTIAHQVSIDGGGKTIAVLGCGVDYSYPKENQKLYDAIIQSGGAIISEYPLGKRPTLWTFPARNRIIAGFADAILVTEAAEKSGSVITANFALRYGRKLFAVPSFLTSSFSKGTDALIKKGASLVRNPKELLQKLESNRDIF